ncbi:MAG: hypothetical protein JNL93_15585 [Pelomonas sp.]|nr:hypothetical protein [Roseateles sp.]
MYGVATYSASRTVLMRMAFMLSVMLSLIASLSGGLVRAGVSLPAGNWLTAAVNGHAFLMICAFMGTVIGIERAVAVKRPLSFAAPIASASGGIAWLAGAADLAVWLVAAASLAFVAVNIVIVRRQPAPHTGLLLVAALAWATGSLLHAIASGWAAVVPLWFSFLVLTIAAERLEMTRLMRRRPGASGALYIVLAAMLLGAALSALSVAWGGLVYGLSLSSLACWLLQFDIAWRTVRARGLSRYMALCLLLGYAWLFVAGAAWVATSLGLPHRDTALHGLALGFVFSMMLGHAPVILPAIARIKVQFGWPYYLPLALLHGSLVLRLGVGHFDWRALSAGAIGNAVAIAAFAATVAGSAIAWRRRHGQPRKSDHHGIPAEH